MWGRSEDLCHNIGMLENIGQIQWVYLKFVGFAFGLLHVYLGGRKIYARTLECLRKSVKYNRIISGLLCYRLTYYMYAGEEGRPMPQR